jgi:hypothetical protein
MDVGGCLAVLVDIIGAIGRQATERDEVAKCMNGRQAVSRFERDDEFAVDHDDATRYDDQATVGFSPEFTDGILDLGAVAHGKVGQPQAQ